MDKATWNVTLMGVAFLFLFISLNSSLFIEETAVASVNAEYRDSWNGREWNAHELLGINYAVYALAGWISPSLIAITGPKLAMIISGLIISLANIVFIFPYYDGYMISSVTMGFGSAIVWTAQGNFLTINSRDDTLMRNSGIFYVLYQASLLVGNSFIYRRFEDRKMIDHDTRIITYTGLTVCSMMGVIAFFILRPVKPSESGEKPTGPWKALCTSVKLIKTKKMMLLCFLFCYAGLEGSFFSGVYNASVAFKRRSKQNERKRFSGVSGGLTGFGEIAGGIFAIFLGNSSVRKQTAIPIFVGFLIHIVTFAILHFNLHFNESLKGNNEEAVVHTSLILAYICSFFIGFGDACYQNQINVFLGKTYREDSSPPFAIFIFFQYCSSAIAFYYSPYIALEYHIYILTIMATIGTLSFFATDRIARLEEKSRRHLKAMRIYVRH